MYKTRFALITFCLLALVVPAQLGAQAVDPREILLWPDGAPGSEGKTDPENIRIATGNEIVLSGIHKPSIISYLPEKSKNKGIAVIVAPGGGHSSLWTTHEGHNPARWLSEHGFPAFVLKYRLARERGSTYTIQEHAMSDAYRAIRLIRSHAEEWGIDPDRIGIIGFSAGGELATIAAARWPDPNVNAVDPIDKLSSKPNFFGLIYPGAVREELPWGEHAPPAFLVCGETDRPDIRFGLPELYLTLRRANVSAELHVYAETGHGFGLRPSRHGPHQTWIDRFGDWLDHKFREREN